MTFSEQAIVFPGSGEALVGVLSTPAGKQSETAVLIVVGGPQYRVGSHRQFVLLARALAAAGYPVLRFDYRGMGDAGGLQTDFEGAGADIGAALDELQKQLPATRQFAVWGLCDGASAALLYLDETRDPRVSALALLNPWVRSEATLARTHVKHYYLQRLQQREFWSKLVSGQVARQAFGELARNVGAAFRPQSKTADRSRPFQQRMASAMAAFTGPVAVLLSGNDYTAKEFIEHVGADATWRSNLGRPTVTRLDFEGADHTFSSREAHRRLEVATLAWLNGFTAITAA